MGDSDSQGCCKDAVVKLDPTMGLICFILNILFSGLGTLISACAGEKFNGMALCFGLIQFFFAWTIVPWIWSIIHGMWLYQKANGKM